MTGENINMEKDEKGMNEELEILDEKDTEARSSIPPRKKNAIVREVVSWVMTFVVAIAAALLLKNYVIINATVPTGSMENTILPGDDLVGFRLAYLFSEPKRGDIIIFNWPDDESQKYIKRVIGLPGDKVVINEGQIFINDSQEPLDEAYLKEDWFIANGPYEYYVPEDCYFVMGDNRNDSKDSRYWINTYVTREEIVGKALFIYYPFNHIAGL